MRKIPILFIGVVWISLFGHCMAQGDEYEYFRFPEKDLYLSVYEKNTELPPKAIKNTAFLLNISSESQNALQRVLEGKEEGNDLSTICNGPILTSDYYQCGEKIKKVYSGEMFLLAQEDRLHWESLSESAWANGTLEDGSFDVLVDTNIIDTIFFGKNAKIVGGPSPFLMEANNPENPLNTGNFFPLSTNTTKGNGNNDANVTGNNTGSEIFGTSAGNNTSGTTGGNTTNGNQGQNSSQMCIDPDALFFNGIASTGNNSGSGNTGQNNTGSAGGNSTDTNLSTDTNELARQRLLGNFSGSRTRNYLNTSSFPGNTEQCKGQQIALFGQRVCLDMRCNDIICIHISIVPGYRKAQMQDNDCIECSIHKGLEAVQKMAGLKGKLAPADAPTEPWFLTAFATLFREAGGKFLWVWKPLPFLSYDNPQHRDDAQTKTGTSSSSASTSSSTSTTQTTDTQSATSSNTTTGGTSNETGTPKDTKKTEVPKKSREEQIAEIEKKNRELLSLSTTSGDNCELLTSKVKLEGQSIENVQAACEKDANLRALYAQKDLYNSLGNASGQTTGEAEKKKELYTQYYQDLVKIHLTNMSSQASAINSVYGTIDTTVMGTTEEKCSSKAGG